MKKVLQCVGETVGALTAKVCVKYNKTACSYFNLIINKVIIIINQLLIFSDSELSHQGKTDCAMIASS